jgi:beta-glucosidase
MDVTVTVKNTGKTAGKEVVQLYLLHLQKTLTNLAQLKAFGKTNLLLEKVKLSF